MLKTEFKVDRTVIQIAKLSDRNDDREYWISKTPQQRMEAVELMRQILYGYDPATARLQRVLTVAELERR